MPVLTSLGAKLLVVDIYLERIAVIGAGLPVLTVRDICAPADRQPIFYNRLPRALNATRLMYI